MVRTRVPSSADAATDAGFKIVQPSNPGIAAAVGDPVGPDDGVIIDAAGDVDVAEASAVGGPLERPMGGDLTLGLEGAGPPDPHDASRSARIATAPRLAAERLIRLAADDPLAVLLDHLHVGVDVIGLAER
jgi:hypothetical protein